MPDPTPAPANAAAPASPTPAAAAPAADAPRDTKTISSNLFRLLTADSTPATDDKGQKPDGGAPKTEDKKQPAAAAPSAEKKDPPAAAAPEGGIKRKKKEAEPTPTPEDKPPPVPKKSDLQPADKGAPAAGKDTPPAKAETDADFEKALPEEELALLEDARAAEKYLPEKYKGHGGKVSAFLKENVKKLAALEKGELDGKPFEQADYEAWYEKSRPKVSLLDQRTINRLAVKEDVTKEFEPRIAEERHARWADQEAPKIKAKGDQIYRKLSQAALPDDVMAAVTERTKGLTPGTPEYRAKIGEVEKDYALEFEIAQNVIGLATGDIEEFQRLTTFNQATGKALAEFVDSNPQHQRLVSMVNEICAEFKTTGGAELKKDGKWFVTREEWQGMAPQQRAPFWTFTNDELVERALAKVKPAVAAVVAQERKRLEERYGFKRTIATPAAAAAAPTADPAAGAPPALRSAPLPSGGGSAPASVGSRLAAALTNG